MKKNKPNTKPENELDKYSSEGTTFCEMKCDRKVLMTKNGPVIVCNGCLRIVIDNRNS
jgi:hypothetical protein